MDLGRLPEQERKDYLRSLGVDPAYFGIREYQLAHLRSAFDEFKELYSKLCESFEGLYAQLPVRREVQYREPTA